MRQLVIATLSLVAACSGPLTIEGAPCPCPTGYRCDRASSRCMNEAEPPTPVPPPPDAGPTMPPEGPVCADPGPAAVRRLDAEEYANTVLDLLGVTIDTSRLPRETALPEQPGQPKLSPFLTPEMAQKFTSLADEVAALAAANPRQLLPCEPDPAGQNSCARRFAEQFGARAYRRPLAPQELDDLLAAFEEGRRTYQGDRGLRRLIAFALVNPAFIFRTEVGERTGPRAGVVSLTPFEIASRLSYFLWATTPDQTLWSKALAGQLRTKAEVRAEAERLLASPRAEAVVAAFHRRWLGLEDLRQVPRPAAGDDPAFTAPLREALITGAQQTLAAQMWQRAGDQAALFAGPLVGNRPMSEFYGLSAPGGDGFEELSPLGRQQRFGVLTLPAVLARLGHGAQSAPVRRGGWVLGRLLCRPYPPAPGELPLAPPPAPGMTTRDLYAEHTKNPTCAACHNLFDPIGFGLENYDGHGRWREMENGRAIDASGSGTLLGSPFDGPGGLAALLAKSEEVTDCVASQWFRFAVGRAPIDTDACTLGELERAFVAGGRRLRPLLLAIATSDAFLTRRAP